MTNDIEEALARVEALQKEREAEDAATAVATAQEIENAVNGFLTGFVLDMASRRSMLLPALEWTTHRTEDGAAYATPVFATLYGPQCVTGMYYDGFFHCSFGVFDSIDALANRLDYEAASRERWHSIEMPSLERH